MTDVSLECDCALLFDPLFIMPRCTCVLRTNGKGVRHCFEIRENVYKEATSTKVIIFRLANKQFNHLKGSLFRSINTT